MSKGGMKKAKRRGREEEARRRRRRRKAGDGSWSEEGRKEKADREAAATSSTTSRKTGEDERTAATARAKGRTLQSHQMLSGSRFAAPPRYPQWSESRVRSPLEMMRRGATHPLLVGHCGPRTTRASRSRRTAESPRCAFSDGHPPNGGGARSRRAGAQKLRARASARGAVRGRARRPWR